MAGKNRGMKVLCVTLAVLIAAATPATRQIIYRPWTASGLRSGLTVAQMIKGKCWTNSISTDRPDAFRCMAGNDIWDPCFAGAPKGGEVACVENPFSSKVVVMKLTAALPKSSGPYAKMLEPNAQPWALELASGGRCYFATGATGAVNGERMNYECKGNDWIVGFPKRSPGVWTATAITWPDKKHVRTVDVSEAVF